MQRITEPELMDDQAQSEAYAAADFSRPTAVSWIPSVAASRGRR